jgi:CheY-like chemotaxis protein
LDLRLPGLDGFQFREAQLKDPSIAHIPVFLISADTGLEEKNIRFGAKGVLKKPVELEALVDMVKQQLLH